MVQKKRCPKRAHGTVPVAGSSLKATWLCRLTSPLMRDQVKVFPASSTQSTSRIVGGTDCGSTIFSPVAMFSATCTSSTCPERLYHRKPDPQRKGLKTLIKRGFERMANVKGKKQKRKEYIKYVHTRDLLKNSHLFLSHSYLLHAPGPPTSKLHDISPR